MVKEIGSIKDKYGTELLRMWQVDVPPGARQLVSHSHVRFEIMTVKDGDGTITYSETRHNMKKGDVFVFSSNEKHCITDVGSGGLTITNIHFEPRYLWGAHYDRLTERYANFCFLHSDSFENCIADEKSEPIRTLSLYIEQEFLQNQPENHLMIKSYLNQIVIRLIRDFGYANDCPTASRTHFKSIQRALGYVDDHLQDPLTLNEIAKIADLSPNYFSAVFANMNGISLWDYIQAKRVEKAMYLINQKENTVNMLEIALSCGFNNTANFNRAFKKVTDMTPSEYKKSAKLPT